jgi:hypothetical protein
MLGISRITLPETLESIGAFAFAGCDNLKIINYNAINCQTNIYYLIYGYQFICPPFQSGDFYSMNSVNNIVIGNKVESIDSGLFECCAITSIRIPSNVNSIAANKRANKGAFANCAYLSEILVEKPENSIEGAPWSDNTNITVKWNQ